MLGEYIKALFLIFFAEMGDKTQILAMMFATRFKVSKVMLGILIGSFLNHGIAVAFGKYIGGRIPAHLLQMIAGIAFIMFAIWTLSEDGEEEDDKTASNKKKGGAVITVASAFFIGELGDKTQLTAITLSVDAVFPFVVLLGTVSGMLVTSGIGIYIGSKLGDRIPDILIKIISGTVFMVFGIQKLYSATPVQYINPITVSIFALVVLVTVTLLIRTILLARKLGKVSPYKRAAGLLHDYVEKVKNTVDDICLGPDYCGHCEKGACAIGYIRELTKDIIKIPIDHSEENLRQEVRYYKNKFDVYKLTYVLAVTLNYLDVSMDDRKERRVNEIRNVLEMMLFDTILPWNDDLDDYLERAEVVNKEVKMLVIRHLDGVKGGRL
ncbi:MAG: hypothetical protein CVU84_10480 [Firmicutes bacterium HGW-Firmicutes-1]|jgi:putative Ca2+/H+ antiporter (TMEM165/GDT1 family)|nr:MAG: hypothetical protein CVU84_10480 [Firmicutes bacterium HGW-Firmicutes-1]